MFTATEMEKIELLERMALYLKASIHKLGNILVSGANISVSNQKKKNSNSLFLSNFSFLRKKLLNKLNQKNLDIYINTEKIL